MNAALLREFMVRRRKTYLVIAICLFVLAALLHFSLKPLQTEYFPVRFVRIQGALKHLDKFDVEASVRPLLESGYWDLDLDQIRSGAAKLPWIRAIQIQRVWPDTLVLRIEEHAPFARFGQDRLLSTRGVAYSPRDAGQFEGLPWIDGPVDQSKQLFKAFREMRASAQNRGISLENLRVTERESWTIQSSEGLTIELGRESPKKTFRRFVSTLSLLGDQQIRSMVRVDLRYRNGYAVEWKAGTEPEWSSFVKRIDPRQGEAVQSI